MTTAKKAALLAAFATAVLLCTLTLKAPESPSAGSREVKNLWNSPSPRYVKRNKELGPPSAERHRVVFLGDSVVDYWNLEDDFSQAAFETVNRGIAGQTTKQLLLRLKQDALELGPRAVVLIGGINDPKFGDDADATIKNLSAMAQKASAAGVRPVVATLWTPRSPETGRVNAAIREFCRPPGCAVADFERVFCPEAACNARRFSDGIHPNRSGYGAMAAEIKRALAR